MKKIIYAELLNCLSLQMVPLALELAGFIELLIQ